MKNDGVGVRDGCGREARSCLLSRRARRRRRGQIFFAAGVGGAKRSRRDIARVG